MTEDKTAESISFLGGFSTQHGMGSFLNYSPLQHALRECAACSDFLQSCCTIGRPDFWKTWFTLLKEPEIYILREKKFKAWNGRLRNLRLFLPSHGLSLARQSSIPVNCLTPGDATETSVSAQDYNIFSMQKYWLIQPVSITLIREGVSFQGPHVNSYRYYKRN